MKYSKKYIWYRFISMLPFSLPFLFILNGITLNSKEESMEITDLFKNNFLGIDTPEKLIIAMIIVFLIWAIFSIIYCLLSWKYISYSFSDDSITLNKGIIYKKKLILPYNKIHAVTVDRSLLMRIFGLSKLACDSGNTRTSGTDEIIIIDNVDSIAALETELNTKIKLIKQNRIQNNIDKEKNEIKEFGETFFYNFSFKQAFKSIFLSIQLYVFLIVAFIVIGISSTLMILDKSFSWEIVIGTIGALLLIFLCVIIYITIVFFLTYYDFKVMNNKDEVIVSHGFFSKYKNYISKDRIRGFTIFQDVVWRKNGYCSVGIEVVGLSGQSNGDSNKDKKKNILFPYIEFDKAKEYLKRINSTYKVEEMKYKSGKNSLGYYLFWPYLVYIIILVPLILILLSSIYFVFPLIILAFLDLITLLLSISKKSNQGIGYDDDNLYISNGIIGRKTVMIPWNNIISLGTISTKARMKNNIVSVDVDYFSCTINSNGTSDRICMVDISAYADIYLVFNKKSK